MNDLKVIDKHEHIGVIHLKIVDLANVHNLDVKVKYIEDLVKYIERERVN